MTNLSEKEKIQLQYKAEQIKTSLSVNDQALYEHYVNGQGYGVLITQAISMKLPWTSSKILKSRYNLPFKRLA